MSNKLCRQAIETPLAAWAAARSTPIPVAWENATFPPDDGTGTLLSMPDTYLRAFLLPARTIGPDLSGAARAYMGVYQVSVLCAIDIGAGTAEGIADEIAALFPLDSLLAVTGLTLQVITPVTSAQGAQDGNHYTVPVSFTYRAYTV